MEVADESKGGLEPLDMTRVSDNHYTVGLSTYFFLSPVAFHLLSYASWVNEGHWIVETTPAGFQCLLCSEWANLSSVHYTPNPFLDNFLAGAAVGSTSFFRCLFHLE